MHEETAFLTVENALSEESEQTADQGLRCPQIA